MTRTGAPVCCTISLPFVCCGPHFLNVGRQKLCSGKRRIPVNNTDFKGRAQLPLPSSRIRWRDTGLHVLRPLYETPGMLPPIHHDERISLHVQKLRRQITEPPFLQVHEK